MDDLELIHKTIEEHHKLRGNLRLVGEAVNDMEGLFSLQQAHASWSQSSAQGLPETMERMQRTIRGLSEGIRNHFGFEERYLPPVFGPNLMKALVFEHNEVRKKLDVCATSVLEDIRGQPQEKVLAYRSTVQEVVADLTSAMENHATREEVVLNMLARALEAEKEARAGS
jgi:hypothetical protein